MKSLLRIASLTVLLAITSCAHNHSCDMKGGKSCCKEDKSCCKDKAQCDMKKDEEKKEEAKK